MYFSKNSSSKANPVFKTTCFANGSSFQEKEGEELTIPNVPPAILLSFLREHRSEWADNGIDAYSAAAVKAGACSLPGSQAGCFGGQVIVPLAHTIDHEEASNLLLIYDYHACCHVSGASTLVKRPRKHKFF